MVFLLSPGVLLDLKKKKKAKSHTMMYNYIFSQNKTFFKDPF